MVEIGFDWGVNVVSLEMALVGLEPSEFKCLTGFQLKPVNANLRLERSYLVKYGRIHASGLANCVYSHQIISSSWTTASGQFHT